MKIKNWESFQHYRPKNGERPIWIKLYSKLLDDYEFQSLPAEARALLPMLWLLAGEDDGNLPEIKKIAFRLRLSEREVTNSIKLLIKNGSIICLESFYTDSIPEDIERGEDIENIDKRRGEETLSGAENFFENKIWPIYPKTRRGNLSKAKRAYQRALSEKRATQEEIYNGLERYRSSDEVERGYAKGAEAWFNADGWTNDYKSPRSDNQGQKPSYMDRLKTAATNACAQIDNELDAGYQNGGQERNDTGGIQPRLSHQPSRNGASMAGATPHCLDAEREHGNEHGTANEP